MDQNSDIMAATVEKAFPFLENMGLKVVKMEYGRVVLKAPFKPNTNHIGSMYAGALFTLAEIPGGALYLSTFDVSKYYPVVKESNIKFKRPAATDVMVEASLSQDRIDRIIEEVEKEGKAPYILELDLVDEKGVVVAQARNTYQIRKMGM